METKVNVEEVEYKGMVFRRYPDSKRISDRKYFKSSKSRSLYNEGLLHRVIWMFEKGPIPNGYQVHHIDEDTGNNSLDNLECLTRTNHNKKHKTFTPERLLQLKENLNKARLAAVDWHKSDEGRAWHKKHWEDTQKEPKLFNNVCLRCQKEFVSKRKTSKYCCGACRQWGTRQNAAGKVSFHRG